MKRRSLYLILCALVTLPAVGQYCAAGIGNACSGTLYEYISNVTIAGLNNTTGCTLNPAYSDYSTLPGGSCTIGSPQPISITIGNYWGTDTVYVFCDWNGNGVLNDAGEQTTIGAGPAGSGASNWTFTGSITAPVGAVASVRMRVVLNYGTATPTPCPTTATVTYGEIEDYSLCTANCPPPPCALVFTSPNGPGSIQMDHTACGPVAGAAYFVSFTFAPGLYPAGWFFGLDISIPNLLGWFYSGYPFVGPLGAAGDASFGPTPGGFLPSGFQFWAVSTIWAPGYTQFLLAYAPKTYTIP